MPIPSAVESNKQFATHAYELLKHDPDALTSIVSPDGGATLQVRDMKDFREFAAGVIPTAIGANGISLLEIVACENPDGTGNVTQIKVSEALAADDDEDQAFLEVLAEEIAQINSENDLNLRYAGARITTDDATDEATVFYCRTSAAYPQGGLTPLTTIT